MSSGRVVSGKEFYGHFVVDGVSVMRTKFGDMATRDVRRATTDCGDGPCTCGGHGHVHPAHANDREARRAVRRSALADAARAGVADARLKVEQGARLRAFLQSGRRAR